jgi:hypothetical protein
MGCGAFILAIIAALGIALRGPTPYEVAAGADVSTTVAGTWDWAGRPGTCTDNPHTISFSADRSTMILRFAKPMSDGHIEARYDVHRMNRSGVRGAIEGETRRTPSGQPVVWDLVLMSPDSYRWHRTDWSDGGYTGLVIRCPRAAGKGAAVTG